MVCLRYLRDLRETLGFRLCNIAWVLLRVILPQIALITQRNAASCIISQRKTVWVGVVFVVFVVLSFWGSSASSARSAGDIGVSFVQYSLSTLM